MAAKKRHHERSQRQRTVHERAQQVFAIGDMPHCDCGGFGSAWEQHDGRCELKKALIRKVDQWR